MKLRILSILLCFSLIMPAVLTACGRSEQIVPDLSVDGSSTSTPSVGDESSETGNGDEQEESAEPRLTCFMTDDDYYDVQQFYIFSRGQEVTGGSEPEYIPVVGFSFVDLDERVNTAKTSEPYVFLDDFKIDGYIADAYDIDNCLKQLLNPSFAGVVKTSPTDDDLARYGLAHETDAKQEQLPEYVIAFNHDVTDDRGIYVETQRQRIYLSKLTENNTRYAFTEICKVESNGSAGSVVDDIGMIVEVNVQSLDFLEWDRYEWIDPRMFWTNIAFCKEISIRSSVYSANFTLDNSLSDCTETIHSTYIKVHATDSRGNEKTPFTYIEVVDESGNIWTITSVDVWCCSASGRELTITTAYYDYNSVGKEVCVLDGYISCADGSKVYARADDVTVVSVGNGTASYCRYELPLFRTYYQTLLYATYYAPCELSDSEKASVVTDDNLILTLIITDTDGTTSTYKFYSLTSNTSYVTVNGNGLFSMSNSRVNKLISNAQNFFSNQPIDPKSDN